MAQFHSKYYPVALRTGIRPSEKCPGNIRLDLYQQEVLVSTRIISWRDADSARAAQERIKGMTAAQKAALLAQLERDNGN